MEDDFVRVFSRLVSLGAASAALLAGGVAASSPAIANTCVSQPVTSNVGATVCADAGVYDSDPSAPGAGVQVAASGIVNVYGPVHFCTGYYGDGANVYPFGPVLGVVALDPLTYSVPHAC